MSSVWWAIGAFGDVGGHGSARGTASERRGNNLKGFPGVYLKTEARIWPWLAHVFQVRSTAEDQLPQPGGKAAGSCSPGFWYRSVNE